jgi:hypothetical protein
MPIRAPEGYLDITNATLRASEIVTTSNVGIANANPTNTLSIGSNVFFEDTSSNAMTVRGNVVAEGIKLGFLQLLPSYDLELTANVGNSISNTVQFTNSTTGFVTSSNVGIGTNAPDGLVDVGTVLKVKFGNLGATAADIIDGYNTVDITESGGTYTYTRDTAANYGNFLPSTALYSPITGRRYRVRLTARSDFTGSIRLENPANGAIVASYDLTTTFTEYEWEFTSIATTMYFRATLTTGTTMQFNAFSMEVLEATANTDIMMGGTRFIKAHDASKNFVAIGPSAGQTSQGSYATAVGNGAGDASQGVFTIAVGSGAGRYNQGDRGVAVGAAAGNTSQSNDAVAVGYLAGQTSQGAYATAVGQQAGQTDQGSRATALGVNAGRTSQGVSAVAVGDGAAITDQGTYAVAVGYVAGSNNQGGSATAVGNQSGRTSQGTNAVAVGVLAGNNTQGTNTVAVGNSAGQTEQANNAIAIGSGAGQTSQGLSAVTVGLNSGRYNQGTKSVAIGVDSGVTSQGNGAIAVGDGAGNNTQGAKTVAVGYNAGKTDQATSATAVGDGSGYSNQGTLATAVGVIAGQFNQGDSAVAVGAYAGLTSQGERAVAVGISAGNSNQLEGAVAMGSGAGERNQGGNAVAVGRLVGYTSQGAQATAVGYKAGQSNQGTSAVAVGLDAGNFNQGAEATAVGRGAGYITQGTDATAVGHGAGLTSQGENAVAVGNYAGYSNQGTSATAVGYLAGGTSQGNEAVAVGRQAGQTNQGTNATAVGVFAGLTSQGNEAVAVGRFAGAYNQHNNSIVLNATGSALNTAQASSFYVKPVRGGNFAASALAYTSAGEIVEETNVHFDASGNVGIGTASPAFTLDVHGTSNVGALTATTATVPNDGDFVMGGKPLKPAGGLHWDRVNSRLGVGTASPACALDIASEDVMIRGNTPSINFSESLVGAMNGAFRIRYDGANKSGINNFLAIQSGTNFDTTCLHCTLGGNVGIGTTNPAGPLHIKQSGVDGGGSSDLDNQAQGGITVERSDAANRWIQGINALNNYHFWYDADGSGAATSKAFFDQDGSNNIDQNFTGQHRTFIKDIPFTRAVELEGLIVSADNNKYIKMTGGIEVGSNAITTNESLPVVSLSTRVNDKKCFGIISASEDPETRENRFGNIVSVSQKELGDIRVYINSVGEGAMWVTNINGPLESGDYITTSNVAGYGQKQDSEFLANYTVAKITMDCDFNPQTQPVQRILKELVNVNYWVKTTVSNVTEEEYSNLTDENRTTEDETYYTKDIEQKFTYKPTVEVTAEDAWDDVSIWPSDVTYAEWSNLEANVQNTYTLTYTQNDYESVRYEKTTVSNVTVEDAWDAVYIEPSTVTYAEWSNLEANVQNTYSLTYTTTATVVATEEEYNHLVEEEQVLYEPVYTKTITEEVDADTEGADVHTRTLYKKIEREESNTETEGYELGVRQELVNTLDEHDQLQWEDDPSGATEKAYKIRYLDASGTQTDEANAVHIAAFVGVTYHCG